MRNASGGRVSGLGFATWYGFPADVALISNHVAVKFFHYVLILGAPVDRRNTSTTARCLKILISPVSKRMLHQLVLFLFFKHSCFCGMPDNEVMWRCKINTCNMTNRTAEELLTSGSSVHPQHSSIKIALIWRLIQPALRQNPTRWQTGWTPIIII